MGNDGVGPDNKKLGVCFGYVVDKAVGPTLLVFGCVVKALF